MSRDHSSDPLPYTQIDRAVKAKAAILAGALGLTNQHALGSMAEFWELNGDPREIERLITEGKDQVVISEDLARLRFRIASGKDAPTDLLVELGFLEPVETGLRVRGMSRYFEPIRRRLQAREAASAGGKASAAIRKAKNGTAQPSKVVRDAVQEPLERNSSDAEATLEATLEATAEAAPKRAGSATEAADSGQRTAPLKDPTYVAEFPAIEARPPRPPAVSAPTKAVGDWGAEDFWRWAQFRRQESGLIVERMLHPAKLSSWWSEARGLASVEGLRAAFNAYGKNKHWEAAEPPFPFSGFMSQWDRFVPPGGANAARS